MEQNLLSSGVTPEYLKALSDAYNRYFPQQQPLDTAMLQQWYGQQQAASQLPQNAAPTSVVGSLFGQQYPEALGGGGSDATGARAGAWGNMTPEQQAAFYGENPTMAAITRAGQGLFANTALGQLQAKLDPTIQARSAAITRGTQGLADYYAANGLAGYGGGYGMPGAMTSATGANIAANPMGYDPQQAQAAMQGRGAPQGSTSGLGFAVDLGPAIDLGPGPGPGISVGPSGPSVDFGGFDRGDRGNY